ncbi:MAG: ShlB/FhaC/HecB family hemolysin secretion/activation protein [Deltaproteobacteria bacterium]|nr:ShlB/FhaC/HecB family hemolysin secretion/activation protein [Deltaproteobacteria bacterium]
MSIAGLVALPSSSGAQDLRKFEPLPVPPQVEAPGGALKPPPVPDQPGQDERVLVDALRGLVFIDRSDAAVPKVQMPPDGIDVRRLPRLQTPDFRKLVEPYLGRPVSRAVLNRLVGGIHAYYNKRDMPFVSVTLPEQDITTGVVQVLVVEGTLGRLRVEGTKWFSEKQYLSAIRMRPGDPIRLSVLNEDIAWINRNPFRQADVFFDQGETVGGTNLVLRTKERLPLRAYIGYNNNGSESTDRNQFLAGFNWGNAFGLGHLLSYQYMTSPDLQQLRGHSLSYMIPLPWRDTLTISGTYSEIKPDMPTPFRRDGMSAQAVLRYDVDLKPLGPLKHALGVLFEYKVTDNNLLFGGIPVTDNRTEIMQLSGVYAGEIADPWGFNTFSLRLTESPGGLSSRNKTQYFEASRAFASADYFYGALDLSRRQKLPFDFALVLSGRLQLADGNLLGSEQLSLGGANSVRGFDEGIIYGDRGYIMHAELHAPVIPLHQWLPLGSTPLLLQLLGFYDHGAVGNVDRLPKEDRQYTLKSAGLGLRFAVSRHAAINFDYGWRLMEFPGIDYNSRGHLSITLSY